MVRCGAEGRWEVLTFITVQIGVVHYAQFCEMLDVKVQMDPGSYGVRKSDTTFACIWIASS